MSRRISLEAMLLAFDAAGDFVKLPPGSTTADQQRKIDREMFAQRGEWAMAIIDWAIVESGKLSDPELNARAQKALGK